MTTAQKLAAGLALVGDAIVRAGEDEDGDILFHCRRLITPNEWAVLEELGFFGRGYEHKENPGYPVLMFESWDDTEAAS